MKHLFRDWDKIKKNLSHKYIMLFLDYDGTLAPIAETPQGAFIPQKTKSTLMKLAQSPEKKIVIVSGRSVSDVRKRLGIKEVIYVGNHGLEIEGPKIKFRSPLSVRQRAILEKVKRDLTDRLSSIKGVIVEDKGLSLGVHFRLVNENQIPKVKTIFHETVIVFLAKAKIKIKAGKKVLEVRLPLGWDKGRAVLWLLARQKCNITKDNVMPVYIGDDVTDEDAFKVLKNKGLTIFVGEPKKSNAQYYLKDTGEVGNFLQRMANLSLEVQ